MIVNYYKMTGDELKRIFDVSPIKGDQFAEILGLTRGQLYTQFQRRNRSIDPEIEKLIKKHPEISKHQQLFKVETNVEEDRDDKDRFYPTEELWSKTMEMLNETIRLLADDNKFIKEDAGIFRSIVDQGVKSGAIRFDKPILSNSKK